MRATTKTMQQYRNDKVKNTSLEELSSLYRQQPTDYIVAEAYLKLTSVIFNVYKKYTHLELCDCVSFALEKLEMCLLTYVPGSANKFTTYFAQVLRNKLREETQRLNWSKRCVIFNSTSLQYLMEQGFDCTGGQEPTAPITLPNTLTKNEAKYCELLAMNYGTNKEIAEFMSVSVMTLCNMRRSLRQKLECLL